MARGVDNGMVRLMVELDLGKYQDQFMLNALRRVNKPREAFPHFEYFVPAVTTPPLLHTWHILACLRLWPELHEELQLERASMS